MEIKLIVKIYKDCRIKNSVYYLDSKDIQAKTAGSRIVDLFFIGESFCGNILLKKKCRRNLKLPSI